MRYRACITGWGKYVPERILTNQDLERMVDTSDEWIRSRTGIRERRVAADHETVSSMAAAAGSRALALAGVEAGELDLIIVATCTPENFLPAAACVVQDRLGARRAAAFDLNVACAGFMYALATGAQFIETGAYRRVLVVGAEVLSRIVDWTDRTTCVLFGDGAGAVVLEAGTQGGLRTFFLAADGAGGPLLYSHGFCHAPAAGVVDHYIHMNGPEVFRFAVGAMANAARRVTEAAGLAMEDVDLFIPHQANYRIVAAAAKSLGIPMDRVYVNLDRYGNTSAASVPLALAEAADDGRLRPGDRVVMVGFGAGLSWAASLVEWVAAPVAPAVAVEDAAGAGNP
ncbi:MAG TPA: beta-ketoacyl-ACP synthase III [Dehalococcoidia bacterium]